MSERVVTKPEMLTLARALRAAISDKQLEESGHPLALFFDTDVITGAFYSLEQIERDKRREQSGNWAIVRALWARGALTPVRLTLPHARELWGVIERIRKEGGTGASQQARVQSFLREVGLAGVIEEAKRRLSEAPEPDRSPAALATWLLDNLSPLAFAALDAEAAAASLRPPGALDTLVDLESESGDDVDALRADPRTTPIRLALSIQRGEQKVVDRSTTDAEAIVALSRLRAKYEMVANGPHVRFYTQSSHVRKLCLTNDVARHALGGKDAKNTFIDDPGFALRSSRYIILRATIKQLAFDSLAKQFGSLDFSMDLEGLRQIARVVEETAGKNDSGATISELSRAVERGVAGMSGASGMLERLTDGGFCYRVWMKQSQALLQGVQAAADGAWRRVRSAVTKPSEDVQRELTRALAKLESSLNDVAVRRGLMSGVKAVVSRVSGEGSWRVPLAGVDTGLERWLVRETRAQWDDTVRRSSELISGLLSSDGQVRTRVLAETAQSLGNPDTPAQETELISASLLTLGCFSGVEQALRRESQSSSHRFDAQWLSLWCRSLSSAARPPTIDAATISTVMGELKQLHNARDRRASGKDPADRRAALLAPMWATFYASRVLRGLRSAGRSGDVDDVKVAQLVMSALRVADDAEFAQYGGAVYRNVLTVELLLLAEAALMGFGEAKHSERVIHHDEVADAEMKRSYYFRDALYWARQVVVDGRRPGFLPGGRAGENELRRWPQEHGMPPAYVIESYQVDHIYQLIHWERDARD